MKLTRDGAIWWIGMAAGAVSYVAANLNLFPVPEKWQGTVQALAAGLTWLSGYLRMSPLKLSPDHPMATSESDQTLSITGQQKE